MSTSNPINATSTAPELQGTDVAATPGQPQEDFELQDDVEPTNEAESTYPTGAQFWAILTGILLSIALVGLDGSILATAVPTITNDFKTTSDIGWYSAAARLTYTSLLFLFGKLYTVTSIKRTFLVALVIFELGSLLATVAPSSKVLVLARAVSGVGVSGLISGAFTILTQSVPLRKRALYGGLAGGVETLAAVSGPLIGGFLTDKFTWRACFGINLPLGGIVLVVLSIWFKDPRSNPDTELPLKDKLKKLDLPGTAVFVPSVTCLLLALQWGGLTYSWSDARIIVLFCVFAASLTCFLWFQRIQGDNATLPLRILKQRSIVSGAFFSACANATLAVVEYYMAIYFQAVKGLSPSRSGLLSIPLMIGLGIACLVAATTTTLIGYYAPLMIISTALASIGAGLLTTLPVNANLASLIGFQALLSFGVGLGIQAPQLAAQTVLLEKEVSIGLSVVLFGQGIGPAAMVVAAQSIFQNRLEDALPDLGRNTTNPGSGSSGKGSLDNLGLADVRHHLGGDQLGKALLGLDQAVTQTLYLPVALACLTLLGAVGMEWRSVKKKTS